MTFGIRTNIWRLSSNEHHKLLDSFTQKVVKENHRSLQLSLFRCFGGYIQSIYMQLEKMRLHFSSFSLIINVY